MTSDVIADRFTAAVALVEEDFSPLRLWAFR
jgi:hypothetical protein